jgi:hypothetical protein
VAIFAFSPSLTDKIEALLLPVSAFDRVTDDCPARDFALHSISSGAVLYFSGN